MEKFGEYEFEILNDSKKKSYYIIYQQLKNRFLNGKEINFRDAICGNEAYESDQEARFAAIGHIDLLENGGG
jgi:5-methylcytosine-specific restriction endonuclease McrBC GTP-binding regulatory subunit McrB